MASLTSSLDNHVSPVSFNYEVEATPAMQTLRSTATIQIRSRELCSNCEPIIRNCTPSFRVRLHRFRSPITSRETINRIVSFLHVDPWIQNQLSSYMKSEMHKFASNAYGSFHIVFNVDFLSSMTLNDQEQSMMNWVLNESMDSDLSNINAAPASASSVEALKSMDFTIAAFGDLTCVVCQEELSKGEAIVQMPCSHIYHSQCILQWLKQSHFCPICRFEMLKQQE